MLEIMSFDPSDEPSFLAKITSGSAAIVAALIGVVWNNVNRKLNKHDDHIEKLYANAEADRKLTRDLHDKAMSEVRELHKETRDLIDEVRQDIMHINGKE